MEAGAQQLRGWMREWITVDGNEWGGLNVAEEGGKVEKLCHPWEDKRG